MLRFIVYGQNLQEAREQAHAIICGFYNLPRWDRNYPYEMDATAIQTSDGTVIHWECHVQRSTFKGIIT